jgi:hypothetical protein
VNRPDDAVVGSSHCCDQADEQLTRRIREFQSVVTWPIAFGTVIRMNVMEQRAQWSKAPHDAHKARRGREGPGFHTLFKGTPPRPDFLSLRHTF